MCGRRRISSRNRRMMMIISGQSEVEWKVR